MILRWVHVAKSNVGQCIVISVGPTAWLYEVYPTSVGSNALLVNLYYTEVANDYSDFEL